MAEKREFQKESDVSSEDDIFDSSEGEHSSLYSNESSSEDDIFDSSEGEHSSLYSDRGRLHFDEISEEDLSSEAPKRLKTDTNKPLCDPCLIDKLIRVVASYMCYVCGKHYCNDCFGVHDKSHGFICLESESGKLDGEIADFVSFVMNESDDESEKKLFEDDVCVCDYVDTKHGLDKDKGCNINGITGYANKWWVLCDYDSCCIKIFSLGSNVLQRYIRLGSKPRDVTEIIVENETTEQDSATCSETTISETDNKPDRKHLLAVTFPPKRFILIIDLGKNPAVIHSKIKTEKVCFSIDFYDGHIYTVCEEPSPDSPWSVFILSVEGVALKTFQTDITGYWSSYLTVLNGNTYMTYPDYDRVVCYNDEGRVLHEIRIDESLLEGICVNRSEDKVYVSSPLHNKVYELESDLSRYKVVLDQTTRYMEEPHAICFYSGKLYVSHMLGTSHVTVVRLL